MRTCSPEREILRRYAPQNDSRVRPSVGAGLRTRPSLEEWCLPAPGGVAVQLDAVAVGVGDPGLVALVLAQLDHADLDAPRAQRLHGSLDVVHLQADVAEGGFFGRRADLAREQLDEIAPPCVQVQAKAAPVLVGEIKGRGQAQPVAVELDRARRR